MAAVGTLFTLEPAFKALDRHISNNFTLCSGSCFTHILLPPSIGKNYDTHILWRLKAQACSGVLNLCSKEATTVTTVVTLTLQLSCPKTLVLISLLQRLIRVMGRTKSIGQKPSN